MPKSYTFLLAISLGIILFGVMIKWILLLICFCSVPCKCIETHQNFNLDLDFLYARSCHLRICFSSFPIWMTFISFSCFTALGRTSSIMMKTSGESGYPWNVSDFRENHWVIIKYDDSCSVFGMLFFSLSKFFPITSLWRVFLRDGCWILSNASSKLCR